jgi:hypothetical protein
MVFAVFRPQDSELLTNTYLRLLCREAIQLSNFEHDRIKPVLVIIFPSGKGPI